MERNNERGPSYRDVTVFGSKLREHFGVGHRFELYPPVAGDGPEARRSWHVVLVVWRLDGASTPAGSHAAAFGSNGVWATLPAALHSCLRDAWDDLEEQERVKAASARLLAVAD